MARSEKGISLYLHVPFCTDKCLYCDFYSVPQRGVTESVQAAVAEQTLLQARRLLDAAGNPRVQTVFFGGGTPSVLAKPTLKSLLDFVSPLQPSEWTVEANPETLDRDFLMLCGDSGVTRLSVGIQSLQPRLLSLLRRHASRKNCLDAVELLHRAWRGELSLDFIAGIPGQSVAEVERDLALVDESWPGHVSLYQLTTEPGTPLEALVESGEIVMNPAEKDEELWFAGRAALQNRRYAQYEVSNFARAGKECRHNIRYWRIEPYIGAGPAAVSTLPMEAAERLLGARTEKGAAVRLSNPKSIEAFLKGAESQWGAEVETVSPRDLLLETLMMGLRLADGIAGKDFERRFGRSFAELLPGLWEQWERKGWAVPEEGGPRIRLTGDGLMLLDLLLADAAVQIERDGLPELAVQWP